MSTFFDLVRLLAGDAEASACCIGATTTLPSRLGACESFTVAVSAGGEVSTGRWTSDGSLTVPSPAERAATGSLAAGVRLHRVLQVGLGMPVRYTWRSAGDVADAGGGVGDLGIRAIVEPFADRSGPAPVVILGVDTPTGRSWAQADGPLLADTTGAGQTALVLGGAVERTTGRVPWTAQADLVSEVGALPEVRLGVAGTLGAALGSAWSAAGLIRHERSLLAEGSAGTRVGVQVVHGKPVAWRGWTSVTADLPIPELGRDRALSAAWTFGFAWIG